MIGISDKSEQFRSTFEAEALSHGGALQASALFFTRNEKDAEDLVQETYLKAFRKYFQYEDGTNLRAWLMKILVNTFYNGCRRRKLAHQAFVTEDVEVFQPDETPEPVAWDYQSDEFERYEEHLDDEVSRALAEIPKDYRDVLVLLTIDDLSYREIASTLGIPIGTVMSRLHRGRKLLQQRLRPYAQSVNWPIAEG